jgi:chromosome segregation ATPase
MISQTFDRLRSERQELDEFVEGMLLSLEDLASRLNQRQCTLDERETQLDLREHQLERQQSEHEELTARFKTQEDRITALVSELAGVRTDVLAQLKNTTAGQADGQLHAAFAKLEEQRDDLRERLDVCREELARRADATEQLAATQAELSQARGEILQLREQVDEQRYAGQFDSAAEQDRIALETELELVRRRAAELSELLAEQKDQMTQQQTIWSSELKILRQLLETQSHSLHVGRPSEPVHAQGVPLVASPPAPAAETPSPENPVVDSIMEQFAKLQKDVAQRRKRKLQ